MGIGPFFVAKVGNYFRKTEIFYKKYEIILPVLEIYVFLQRNSEGNKR